MPFFSYSGLWKQKETLLNMVWSFILLSLGEHLRATKAEWHVILQTNALLQHVSIALQVVIDILVQFSVQYNQLFVQ